MRHSKAYPQPVTVTKLVPKLEPQRQPYPFAERVALHEPERVADEGTDHGYTSNIRAQRLAECQSVAVAVGKPERQPIGIAYNKSKRESVHKPECLA